MIRTKKIVITFCFLLWGFHLMAQLPSFQVKNLDNDWKELNELAGEQYTVLDFWATWCKPCVSSIPRINELFNEFEMRGIGFIGVNTDGTRSQAKVKPFCRTLGIEYPVVLDPDLELVKEFNINVYPSLVILDTKGKETYIHEGYSPGDEKIIKRELEKLVNDEK